MVRITLSTICLSYRPLIILHFSGFFYRILGAHICRFRVLCVCVKQYLHHNIFKGFRNLHLASVMISFSVRGAIDKIPSSTSIDSITPGAIACATLYSLVGYSESICFSTHSASTGSGGAAIAPRSRYQNNPCWKNASIFHRP